MILLWSTPDLIEKLIAKEISENEIKKEYHTDYLDTENMNLYLWGERYIFSLRDPNLFSNEHYKIYKITIAYRLNTILNMPFFPVIVSPNLVNTFDKKDIQNFYDKLIKNEEKEIIKNIFISCSLNTLPEEIKFNPIKGIEEAFERSDNENFKKVFNMEMKLGGINYE